MPRPVRRVHDDGHVSGRTPVGRDRLLRRVRLVDRGAGAGRRRGSSPSGGGAPANYGSAGEPCPNCLLPRQAGDTFCEGCGFPFDEEQTGKTIDQPQLDLEAELRKAEEAQRRVEEEAARHGGSGSGPGTARALPGPGPGVRSGPVNQGGGLANQSGPSGGPANQGSQADPELEETMVSSPPKQRRRAGGRHRPVDRDRQRRPGLLRLGGRRGRDRRDAHPFPPYCPERQFELKGDTVRIGRSGKRGQRRHRPDRPADRPRRLAPARRAPAAPGRRLAGGGPGVDERHRPERRHRPDPAEPGLPGGGRAPHPCRGVDDV